MADGADDETGITEHLAAVYDALVELIGETKQAAWMQSSPQRQHVFAELKDFLAERVILIDSAALRLGARAPGVTSPTSHRPRNIAAEAHGDAEQVVSLLVEQLRRVIDDVRQRAASVDGEWRQLLSEVAADLEAQIDGL